MNELVKTIDELYAAFKTDAELQAGKNNKAAGLRARKVSLELEKKLKEFRGKRRLRQLPNSSFSSHDAGCSFEGHPFLSRRFRPYRRRK